MRTNKRKYNGPIRVTKNCKGYVDGSVPHEIHRRSIQGVEYVPNFVFTDLLIYYGFQRSSVSVSMELVDSKGRIYSMTIAEFSNLLKSGRQTEEGWYGAWTFTKKGDVYSLTLADDEQKANKNE